MAEQSMEASGLPAIIQGGMGAGVSGWQLARAVARRGYLGVVSGTALDLLLVRRLQLGDPTGHLRRAIAQFPCRQTAERVLKEYFIEGGKAPDAKFRSPGMFGLEPTRDQNALVVLANFVEVWLAREGHDGPVGINLLDKIQLPNPPSLYGAMLAGVAFVLMGAGIPWQIPGTLDGLARGEAVSTQVALEDDPSGAGTTMVFDPAATLECQPTPLARPNFLGIISSHVVAQALIKRAKGSIEGFVVEGWTAGGHNAPPRGQLKLNDAGEPVYGDRDVPDLDKLKALGRPFWLAGGMGRPGQLAEARRLGAQGIQVGTAFAFCRESGLDPELRARVLEGVRAGNVRVFTDPVASPTGYPFKVVELEGTASEQDVYEARTRICDAGYLRHPYLKPDGTTALRCPAAPIAPFIAQGGAEDDTDGRKCLCNGLMANLGLGQLRPNNEVEPPLLTAGDDLVLLGELMPGGKTSYGADDVLDRLLASVPADEPALSS